MSNLSYYYAHILWCSSFFAESQLWILGIGHLDQLHVNLSTEPGVVDGIMIQVLVPSIISALFEDLVEAVRYQVRNPLGHVQDVSPSFLFWKLLEVAYSFECRLQYFSIVVLQAIHHDWKIRTQVQEVGQQFAR